MSSYTTNAAGVSKYTAERHQRILQELVQQPGNDVCADCKSRAPRWSSWNLGIFICVQCASIHRKIGTHITKVKSVNLDAWTKEQVESVKNMGNTASNAKWNPNESRHPPPTNMEESERDSEMEKYIRAKYETKKFLDRKSVAPSPSYNTPVTSTQPSTSTAIPRQPKPEVEETDPSQTVPLGFGRESRVEFNLPGMGGDIWDGIVQQKRVPPRSKTAPIPESVPRATPPSVSAQPPPQLGVNTAVPTNSVWGDMLALQSAGGSLPASTVQASSLQTTNPYAALSASPSTNMPSAMMNRMGQTRSFTAPAPNPFFNQGHQQQPSTGSMNSLLSVPTGNSFGSVGLGAAPMGGSFGSTGSNGSGAGGMGASPGGLNPFGTSPGVGSAFGTSPIGSFNGSMSVGGSYGAPSGGAFSPTGTLGTTMMSPGQMTSQHSPFQQTAPSPFQQTQPSPFQQSTMSPFGVGAVNSLTSPNTNATSLSAFGAAMSPQGQASNSPYSQASNSPFGQAANSPFAQASNSPYAQPTSSPFGQTGTQFSGSNSPYQTMNPGFQSTPTNNALFLQPNNAPQFQPSTSPFQTSNPPFPQSNPPFQAANTNPFASMGMSGGMNTNPFGQPQYQGQQGWGGM
ncbi:GTPase activating protein for Arf protein [Rhizoctonia solani AG-3 Rhs1AP]|uniref:GTPase activating protein for Arf protein n=2 Tax=Rhizoctonia solani AG-3 TaxID=1086053 RepID=A0A074RHP7_9AGAM|nr:GTPase activating protein for Arf protein [Rhizoctonia solani AG-3 Rhs1AP]KEP46274.1 GTPase activating protein for Arf protein [Rhizoctonia solani 123E]